MDIGLLSSSIFLQLISFRELFGQWESAGVFDILLPFLLIFAVVFGILSGTNILGKERGIQLLVSLVVALITIRFPLVSNFFSVVFPNFGIALAGLIILLILSGLFLSDKNIAQWQKTITIVAAVATVIVVVGAINSFGWFGSSWWQQNWTTIIWIVVIFLVLGAFFQKDKTSDKSAPGELPVVFFKGGGKGH